MVELLDDRSHINCILQNTSVVPFSNFADSIHRPSRICLEQNVKALVWRWRQICPLKINIFTLNSLISTNEVSMLKLAIEVCFENHFGLNHAILLSLGSTKCRYFFWNTWYNFYVIYVFKKNYVCDRDLTSFYH